MKSLHFSFSLILLILSNLSLAQIAVDDSTNIATTSNAVSSSSCFQLSNKVCTAWAGQWVQSSSDYNSPSSFDTFALQSVFNDSAVTFSLQNSFNCPSASLNNINQIQYRLSSFCGQIIRSSITSCRSQSTYKPFCSSSCQIAQWSMQNYLDSICDSNSTPIRDDYMATLSIFCSQIQSDASRISINESSYCIPGVQPESNLCGIVFFPFSFFCSFLSLLYIYIYI